jgi:hypothetical protein
MRAKRIEFERGMDPKKAMNLGVKDKFYELLPSSLDSTSMYKEEWNKLKEFFEDPQTDITFSETDFNENTIVITIKRPPSKLNWFVWEFIADLLTKFHPRILFPQSRDDEKMVLSISK